MLDGAGNLRKQRPLRRRRDSKRQGRSNSRASICRATMCRHRIKRYSRSVRYPFDGALKGVADRRVTNRASSQTEVAPPARSSRISALAFAGSGSAIMVRISQRPLVWARGRAYKALSPERPRHLLAAISARAKRADADASSVVVASSAGARPPSALRASVSHALSVAASGSLSDRVAVRHRGHPSTLSMKEPNATILMVSLPSHQSNERQLPLRPRP